MKTTIMLSLLLVAIMNVSAFAIGFNYLGPRIDGSIIYADSIAHLAPKSSHGSNTGSFNKGKSPVPPVAKLTL